MYGTDTTREYELMTEAHAKLSVIRNCFKSSLRVSRGGETAGGWGWSAVAGGGGRQTVHRERESGAVSNDRKLSLLLLIHNLWILLYERISLFSFCGLVCPSGISVGC
jgi:hypothetical protein